MNTGDWISAGQNIVQGAAILVGGAWAYYKFVRGRTLHRRAELEVDASLITRRPPSLRTRTTMRNTGAADIPLRAKVLRVATFIPNDVQANGRPNWREICTSPVFTDH